MFQLPARQSPYPNVSFKAMKFQFSEIFILPIKILELFFRNTLKLYICADYFTRKLYSK